MIDHRLLQSAHGCAGFRHSLFGNRRQLLQAGVLSALGLGVSQWQRQLSYAATTGALPNHRPAKACIFLFMWGGPSQLETFDLKPDAPDEVRGDFRPIATKVPGLQICEHFGRLAQWTDRLAVIRSLTHDDPAHLSSGHATLTGQLAPVLKSDADPPSAKDSPHLGSLVSRLRPASSGLPSFVHMPWKALHPAAPGGEAPGQHGGWLGPAYDGLLLKGDLNDPQWRPEGLAIPDSVGLERLESRVELWKLMRQQHAELQHTLAGCAYAGHQARALDMIGSPQVRKAFDLTAESEATRDRYGRNIHGQCVLMARRLVEYGVPLVSVNWHNDGKNFWDTHGNNFKRLKNDLIPPADQALAALLQDLTERGLWEDTLVVWVGEFGRKPQITPGNAGREHWPFCYSGLLAGGGIAPGAVYGASDKLAAYPVEQPVSPQDFATTILYALGLPTEEVLLDREHRPHRISSGKVLYDLFT